MLNEIKMREKIKQLLEDMLPLVDLESDFLFSELDSLGVTTILMTLSAEYGIELEVGFHVYQGQHIRSEERRVGKECL